MFSESGIRHLAIAKRKKDDGTNAVLTDKLLLKHIGLRNKGTLSLKTDGIKTHREQTLQTYFDVAIEATSYEADLQLLSNLIRSYGPDGGVLAHVACEKTGTNSYSGVFNFDNPNLYLGLAYEFTRAVKESGCKLTLGARFPRYLLDSLLASAATSDGAWLSGYSLGRFSDSVQPFLIEFLAPSTSALFSDEDIIDYNLKFASKGTKNERTGRENIHRIAVSLEIIASDASIAKMMQISGLSTGAAIKIKTQYAADKYEEILFQAGTLSRKDEYELGDEKRQSKLTFEAELPRHCFAFDFNNLDIQKLTVTA